MLSRGLRQSFGRRSASGVRPSEHGSAIRSSHLCGPARDFTGVDSVGTVRVAEFLGDQQDDVIRADAAGAVRSLLGLWELHVQ